MRRSALGAIATRVPLVLLCGVIFGAAAYGISKQQAKKYTATASLVFRSDQLGQQLAGGSRAVTGNPRAEQAADLRLVHAGDVAAKTAHEVGSGLSAGGVRRSLSVRAPGEWGVVEVSAEATSPQLAAAIANRYARQFVAEQQNSSHAYYASAVKRVTKRLTALSAKERQGPAGAALQGRAQALRALAELRNGNVQVAQAAALPRSASSPKVVRNTILGAALGLLLGAILAFLLARLNRRIKEPKDLAAIYRLPLLGVVPESEDLSAGRKQERGPLPPGEEEAFQLIRAHLRYFNIDRELRTLLVASAAPRDGKTTVARHLAAAAARAGRLVLLLETDLRQPTLAAQLDIQPAPGLSDVLIGEQSLWSATQMVDLESPSANAPGAQMSFGAAAFDVLVAGGAPPPNPGELMESHAMRTLLEQARASYDLVVIDTPPLAAVSDAFPLFRQVDGVVIVGRVGRSRRDIAERMQETLVSARAPLLGVVANGLKSRRLRSYGYEYDWAPRETNQRASAVASASASPDVAGNGSSAAQRTERATMQAELAKRSPHRASPLRRSR